MAKPSIKQYVYGVAKAKKLPVSGTFELTSRCNLSCRMCYIHMTPEQQRSCGRELTTEQWLAVGRQAVDAGMVFLLLTGGEPMLRPDFVTIYTEMVKMGVMVSVNTNGNLVTPEIVECFKKYPPEQVNVTLYGSSPETYQRLCGAAAGYEKAKQGIAMLREAGVRLNLNTTFTTRNAQDMESLIEFARENELPIRTSAYVFPKIRNGCEEQTVTLEPEEHGKLAARFDFLTKNEMQLLSRRRIIQSCVDSENMHVDPKNRVPTCMAGRGSFWVSWNGCMYPCGMIPEISADLTQCSFADCWEEMYSRMPGMLLPEECSTCCYEPICPVCAALTQSLNGHSTVKPEQMCRYIRSYASTFLQLTSSIKVSADRQESDEPLNTACVL